MTSLPDAGAGDCRGAGQRHSREVVRRADDVEGASGAPADGSDDRDDRDRGREAVAERDATLARVA